MASAFDEFGWIIIVVCLIVVLALAYSLLVGLVNLSKLSFGTKTYDELSTSQRNFARFYVVMSWIFIGAPILVGFSFLIFGK